MYSKEEKLLNQLKSDYDTIGIPENIDDFIRRGLVEHPKRHSTNKYIKYATAAVVAVLFLLTASIRLSPVFADYLQDVPIFKYIVRLVNYDKGLKAAVENQFIQHINRSVEHENIKFTIDSIIIDQARMIIFYTLENNSEYKFLSMGIINFKDAQGENIPVSCGYGYASEKETFRKIQERINVSFSEGISIPDVIGIEMELHGKSTDQPGSGKLLPYIWKIDIPVDKSRFEKLKQVYKMNQTVEIGGQNILIQDATVYPTKIALDISFAEDNSKQIFQLENARIVNERGERLSTLTNDVFASHIGENQIKLYFESDYFNPSESLYLLADSVRALDKGKLDVVIDMKQQKLIKTPDDLLSLYTITKESDETTLDFTLGFHSDDKYLHHSYLSAAKVYDSTGKELTVSRTSNFWRNSPTEQEHILITLKGTDFDSPLKIILNDYPTRIEESIKVKIK